MRAACLVYTCLSLVGPPKFKFFGYFGAFFGDFARFGANLGAFLA